MQKFWGNLAVQLGKHAGIVSLVGLLITLSLGYGITKLQFATGQDSYLNKSDQVYKDDAHYEDLFGGQAMVVMISMDQGKTIDQFFTAHNIDQLDKLVAELHANAKTHQIFNVIDPASGCCSVATVRMSDDLPAPFGPSSPNIPGGIDSATSSRARTPFG